MEDESELWVRAALGEFGDAQYLDYEDPAYEHMYVRRYSDGRKFILVPAGADHFAEHPLPSNRVPISERSYAPLSFPDDEALAQRRLMAELLEMREMGIGIVYRDDKVGSLVRDYGAGRRMALSPTEDGNLVEKPIQGTTGAR